MQRYEVTGLNHTTHSIRKASRKGLIPSWKGIHGLSVGAQKG